MIRARRAREEEVELPLGDHDLWANRCDVFADVDGLGVHVCAGLNCHIPMSYTDKSHPKTALFQAGVDRGSQPLSPLPPDASVRPHPPATSPAWVLAFVRSRTEPRRKRVEPFEGEWGHRQHLGIVWGTPPTGPGPPAISPTPPPPHPLILLCLLCGV